MKKIGILGLSGQSVFMQTDHFHSPGETIAAQSVFIEPGGKGYNQAVAAARLGGQVCFLTCLGEDPYADVCNRVLLQEGIVPLIVTTAEASTALACILTDRNGENQVTVYRGAADFLTRDVVYRFEETLANCDILLVQLELPLDTVEAVVEIGEAHHIPVVLNPAPAHPISLELLRKCFVITPNWHEACTLVGIDPSCATWEQVLDKFSDMGLHRIVMTLGAQGAAVLDRNRKHRFYANRVSVLDTTGAGDTLNGALVTLLAQDIPLEKAVPMAMEAATFSTQHYHVLDSIPHLHDLTWTI